MEAFRDILDLVIVYFGFPLVVVYALYRFNKDLGRVP